MRNDKRDNEHRMIHCSGCGKFLATCKEVISLNIICPKCYTVKEVQEMLGISRPTVYELLKKNEFRWIQIGNKYRISKKSFDEWLDQKSETI